MGTGGTGTTNSVGVVVEEGGASVTSAEGDIEITGFGGPGTGFGAFGVILDDGGVVSSTGAGADAARWLVDDTFE